MNGRSPTHEHDGCCSTRRHPNWTPSTKPYLRETTTDAAKTTTVVVVAHRLSTVTMADRIIVMDAGTVRAIGTHRELAATQFLATAD